MARVNVDSSAFNDCRVKLLAKLLGTDFPSALGKMCCIWEQCTELETYELPECLIDSISESFGFAGLMWQAKLAELVGHDDIGQGEVRVFRIKGTQGRIEWKKSLRERSAKGGETTRKKHRANRPKKSKAKTEPTGSRLAIESDSPITTSTTTTTSISNSLDKELPNGNSPLASDEGDPGLGSKVKTYSPEEFNFAKFWLESLRPKKSTKSELETAADAVRKLRKIDGYDFELLQKLFEFVRQDDDWRQWVQSPTGLRRRSKNGQLKIENAIAAMERAGFDGRPQETSEEIGKRLHEEAMRDDPTYRWWHEREERRKRERGETA